MQKVLIVEDEFKINNLITNSLTLVGYQCFQAYSGLEALNKLNREAIDIVILDIQLPDVDGFTLIKSITDVPVLFLTARDSIEDRVRGLNLGAEDYLIKPFAVDELLARIHVILRRSKREEIFYLKDASVSLLAKQVFLNEEKISLTPQEYALLEVLILNKNMALSREQLLTQAWGMDYDGDDRTVDVHIQRLRRKLNLKNEIATVFKLGYRLEVV